jgi:Ca-activated chloride channel family protein
LTVAASLTFLTPRAALLAVLALVPVAALVIGGRRVERARRILRLSPPSGGDRRRRVVLLVAVTALLAVAAMQPVVRTQTSLRARTDAQAFVVIDVSRSMAAAPAASGPSRLARAKRAALAIAPQLGDVPVGVATLTDRTLPDLFPSSDRAAFDSAVSSLTVEDPPPREVSTVATTFDALRQVATQGFFAQTVRKRAIVLVTDGESRAFDPDLVARSLGSGPSAVVGVQPRTRALSPIPALLALLPLALLLGAGAARDQLRGVTFAGRAPEVGEGAS